MSLRRLVTTGMILAALCFVPGRATAEPAGSVSGSNTYANKTGAVAGTVRFPGAPRPPGVLKIYKEQAFCGSIVPDPSLMVAPDGGLRNVVITLHGPHLHRAAGLPEPIQLDNIGCRFAPHVQAAQVGSTVLLLNSDRILHDAHARMGPRTLFNDGLPRWRRVTRALGEPGIVKVICELHHAWMSAYIVVAPNRFFAVTDSRGRYAIDGIPPGVYEAHFWHERLGTTSRRVVVSPGAERRLDLVLGRR